VWVNGRGTRSAARLASDGHDCSSRFVKDRRDTLDFNQTRVYTLVMRRSKANGEEGRWSGRIASSAERVRERQPLPPRYTNNPNMLLRASTSPPPNVNRPTVPEAPLRPSSSKVRLPVTAAVFPIVSTIGIALLTLGMLIMPTARADNSRFNNAVIQNVRTLQYRAGCRNDVLRNPGLQAAAETHTRDLLNNRDLGGDIDPDGSTPQTRAASAGFRGQVAETVAINPALAISGVELMRMWLNNPDYVAIMTSCTNTQIGVWSGNSLDRTVVVALYGHPNP
jgi:uncharacterized protein YkwD